jgi:hypothetical protein
LLLIWYSHFAGQSRRIEMSDVTDYGGHTKVLGKTKRFLYRAGHGGKLTLYEVTPSEWQSVLQALEGSAPAKQLPIPATVEAELAPAPPKPRSKTPKKPTEQNRPVPGQKPLLVAVPPPTTDVDPSTDDRPLEPDSVTAMPEEPKESEEADLTQEAPESTGVDASDPWGLAPDPDDTPLGELAAQAPGAPEPEDEPAEVSSVQEEPKGNGGGQTDSSGVAYSLEVLQSKKKLRDILATLIDSGYTKQGQLIQTCIEIKNVVPVLSRISDLESRIPRTLEVMGYDG